MEDKDIIGLFNSRSETAIEATQSKYGAYCNTIAYNILSDPQDAEECVSDAMLRTWNAIPPAQPSCLRSFIGRITRNLALDRYDSRSAEKRGGGQLALALEELAESLPAPEDRAPSEITAVLNVFLAGLPRDERVIFVRRYWYLDPVRDIAQKLGFSESKVKTSLFRARGQLRQLLTKEGIEI